MTRPTFAEQVNVILLLLAGQWRGCRPPVSCDNPPASVSTPFSLTSRPARRTERQQRLFSR
jgi:hypothetical protein